MVRRYFVYIMVSNCHRVLYVGFTNDLHRRIFEQQSRSKNGFTEQYNVTKLVHYEVYYYVNDAIAREKQLKKWRRVWKEDLISTNNPSWFDLSDDPRIPPSIEISNPH